MSTHTSSSETNSSELSSNKKPSKAFTNLVSLLSLKNLAEDTFESSIQETLDQRIYGGQVAAQALVAATSTVPLDRPAISLKSDFLRPGDPKQKVLFKVEPLKEGRSFSTRRVTASQLKNGKEIVIFTLTANFQVPEEGFDHQIDMGNITKPQDLENSHAHWAAIESSLPKIPGEWYASDRSFEERPLKFINPAKPEQTEAHNGYWFRANGTVNNNPQLDQALFTYISDMRLLDTCVLPHGVSWMTRHFQSASLDHSVWFHRAFSVNEWLLFLCDSPVSHGGRGFNRAQVYTESGLLVASVIQEGVIRLNK